MGTTTTPAFRCPLQRNSRKESDAGMLGLRGVVPNVQRCSKIQTRSCSFEGVTVANNAALQPPTDNVTLEEKGPHFSCICSGVAGRVGAFEQLSRLFKPLQSKPGIFGAQIGKCTEK